MQPLPIEQRRVRFAVFLRSFAEIKALSGRGELRLPTFNFPSKSVTSARGFIFIQQAFEHPLNRIQNFIHLATYVVGRLVLNEDESIKNPSASAPEGV